MTLPTAAARRQALAEIARTEASSQRQGDAQQAGPEIERYLAVFREALNRNAETTRYSDPSVGYHWCCAFVYYCCQQAGFDFPPKPVPTYRYMLAAVPAWHHWAVTEGFYFSAETSAPEPGDIALYNHVDSGQPLDHIGIVVEVSPTGVRSAEGNMQNRTGLFDRPFSCIAGYVRLPDIFPDDPAGTAQERFRP